MLPRLGYGVSHLSFDPSGRFPDPPMTALGDGVLVGGFGREWGGEDGDMPNGLGNLVWLVVGVLAIIALIVWLSPHIN
jgi:hypothetical protein